MALLWLPEQPVAVTAKQGERSPAGCGGSRGSVGRSRSARPTPPRHATCPKGQGRLTAGCRWLRAATASGPALRKLVCPSGSRVPRAVGDASPAAASPRPAAAAPWAACQAAASILRRRQPRRPPRPQLSRSRHANFWLGTKGSARAGRGRARLPLVAPPPLARRSLEAGSAGLAGGPPAPRAAPPGQPPWKPERKAECPGEEGGGGAAAGAGKRSDSGGERGSGGGDWRPRHRRRGFCAGRGVGASRSAQRAHAPRAPRPEGKPRPREGERKGAAPRASAAPQIP